MKLTQLEPVPVFLIIFAAVSIATGSHYGWHDLVTFAVGFGGAGVGILKANYSRKDDETDVPPNQ